MSTSPDRAACDRCAAPATYAYVTTAEVKATRAEHDSRATSDGVLVWDDFLDAVDGPARWGLVCGAHLPAEGDVEWGADLAATRRGHVDFLRHVGEKEWVGELTDWSELAVRLLAPVEAALPRGRDW